MSIIHNSEFRIRNSEFILVLFFLICSKAFAQSTDGYVVPAKVINGDTIPFLVLDEVTINPPNNLITEIKNKPKYSKLIRDVKKVYPYAVIAGVKLKEYNDIIANTPNEGERKKLMKQAEENIKEKFTDDIKNMTFTQGKILLKLIYRQTGVTPYEIVKELRGTLRAIFWQTLARIFDANLKIEYDPAGEDKAIEEIVKQIENGTL
ncbi:MAG: DUF4294 domain-containing protein [Bacteroidales bacterium]